MEPKQISPITAIAAATTNKENKAINHGSPKKKRGAMNIIKVALFMLRSRSGRKSKSAQVEVVSKGMWKRVVGSIRPLHLQDNQSQSPRHHSIVAAPQQICNEQFEDVFPPPMSPCGSSYSAASSCVDSNSRYASAVNLQELDQSDDCDSGSEDYDGDMAIDVKAEEFIAHFYEQMRLQRVDSINRYNEMIARGMI